MNNKTERFNNAITALIKGYQTNSLVKSNACACAVGNMIAYNKGYQILKELDDTDGTILDFSWSDKKIYPEFENEILPSWSKVFCTNNGEQTSNVILYRKIAKDEIDSTGYSLIELMKLEFAFEQHTKISISNLENYTIEEFDKDQFNGLMAVVDVLCEIEEIDEFNKNQIKSLFVKEVS